MPVENLEEEGLPKNPNLELAAWRFTLNNPEGKDKEDAKKKLLEAIKENGMWHRRGSSALSLLKLTCLQFGFWTVNALGNSSKTIPTRFQEIWP